MTAVNDTLKRILGIVPALIRSQTMAYGSYNETVQTCAAAYSMSLVLWSFEYAAVYVLWSRTESEQNYNDALNNNDGTFLPLNHETCQFTVEQVIPQAIQLFASYEWTFVTVAECLGIDPYTEVTTPTHPNFAFHC
ncbi:hypothetical protein B0H11DRAFT_2222816 [Mycena galericulata]|nr:hypothetical protein B0H11DRAFT_2222816 [Mycena galericulata]